MVGILQSMTVSKKKNYCIVLNCVFPSNTLIKDNEVIIQNLHFLDSGPEIGVKFK